MPDRDRGSHYRPLGTRNRIAFEINVRRYRETHGALPWGESPAAPGEQVSIALTALVLLSERFPMTLENVEILKRVAPHVKAAQLGFSAVVAATESIAEIIENLANSR